MEDAFSDEYDLLNELNPIGLRDGVYATCNKDSSCLPFRDIEERNNFRSGMIWHGFGYDPIVIEMVLRSATRICKCSSGFVENKMHGCVSLT